jgi:MSHA biogenesis protein MshO
MRPQRQIQGGFTLVEVIVVMVITGIIGGMVAIFIRAPVQGYVDSSRRAEMADVADTALRRLARDIRTAVPNSVRVPASCVAAAATPCYVEFIPTRDGGRYRADTGGNNNVLSFGAGGTTKFDIIGTAIPAVAGTDYIVIGSTQSNAAPPYDQTGTGVLRRVTAMTNGNTTITFSAPVLPAWAEVQGQRFDVVDGSQRAVTYGCSGASVNANGDGTGTLTRYWNYGFNTPQVLPPAGGSTAMLADHLSACEITYDTVNQRNGLVTIRLGISRGGESISLYHAIHVNNVP